MVQCTNGQTCKSLECGIFSGNQVAVTFNEDRGEDVRTDIELYRRRAALKRNGTTNAKFAVKQMQEKHLDKQNTLFFDFVVREKVCDRVPENKCPLMTEEEEEEDEDRLPIYITRSAFTRCRESI